MPRAMRIKVAYGYYQVGDVIYPPGTTRDLLMQQGYIEEMPADEDCPFEADKISTPADFAPPVKHKRGWPKGKPRKAARATRKISGRVKLPLTYLIGLFS